MSTNNKTTIYNEILSAIGVQGVDNPEEVSPQALEINKHYETQVRGLFEETHWDFAERELPLTILQAAMGTPENLDGSLGPNPPDGFRYAYKMPGTCARDILIRPRLPVGTGAAVPLTPVQQYAPQHGRSMHRWPYRVAGLTISNQDQPVVLTDVRQALLTCTIYVMNEASWKRLFIKALIGRMAALITQPLTGDKTLAKMAIQLGQDAVRMAETANANQGTDTTDFQPDFMAARDSYGGDRGINWEDN